MALMKKKKRLDKVKLVKELSRERIGKVPRTRKLENKKKKEEQDRIFEEFWDNF
jgi:hypothetical protein